jgi:hypothetical protein
MLFGKELAGGAKIAGAVVEESSLLMTEDSPSPSIV